MSVLIKNMKMPKSCDMCWALDDYGDYPRCRITEEQRGYNFNIREKRMDNCPLVSVPSHGRLIDADAFSTKIIEIVERQKYDDFYAQSFSVGAILREVANELKGAGLDGYANAPTIIPAEEET